MPVPKSTAYSPANAAPPGLSVSPIGRNTRAPDASSISSAGQDVTAVCRQDGRQGGLKATRVIGLKHPQDRAERVEKPKDRDQHSQLSRGRPPSSAPRRSERGPQALSMIGRQAPPTKPAALGVEKLEAKQRQNAQRARSERRAPDALAGNDHQKSQAHSESSHTNDDSNARERRESAAAAGKQGATGRTRRARSWLLRSRSLASTVPLPARNSGAASSTAK